ncbi:MAG: glycerophosphodiester phosphodiesterase [Candidatus Heimdallarchaeota archaeon]|nr:MAG: glycerophosphodiester phosphodiesterase [Candidatus Heimdallarchaeota archaeon]
MKDIKIIAHRGYLIKGEPENSIPAFHTAITHGADGLEFDIHLTSDNKFVCFHDDTLEKIGRSGQIKDLPQKELASIELADGILIPTLEEILENFGNRVILNIEVKSQKKGGKELVNLIHQYNLNLENLIVSSFHHSPLKDIKTLDPTIPTGLLCTFAKGQLKKAQELKCNALHPFYNSIPKGWIKAPYWVVTRILKYYAHKSFHNAYKSGILVNPWTVNDAKFIKSAINLNVNSIITDEVEKVLKIREFFSV